jgi:hypothetical protein
VLVLEADQKYGIHSESLSIFNSKRSLMSAWGIYVEARQDGGCKMLSSVKFYNFLSVFNYYKLITSKFYKFWFPNKQSFKIV